MRYVKWKIILRIKTEYKQSKTVSSIFVDRLAKKIKKSCRATVEYDDSCIVSFKSLQRFKEEGHCIDQSEASAAILDKKFT